MVAVGEARKEPEHSACGGFWSSLAIDSKISRVSYLGPSPQNVDVYIAGTWDEPTNKLSVWQVYYGKGGLPADQYFKISNEIAVSSSVNSIFCENQHVIAGLEDGAIEVCVVEGENILKRIQSLPKAHGKFASSTAVCIVDGEIVSGSDSGTIIKIDLSSMPVKPNVLATDLSSVKCMAVLGRHEFVSAHGSGQLHLWDNRVAGFPVFSKAVSSLADSINAIDSHPAQPNVIAYGTNSGSIAFVDVRQYKQPTSNLLKVSESPIADLGFHPKFPKNCFVMSEEGLLHLDLSASKAEKIDDVNTRQNTWLAAASWNLIDINQLEGPKKPSCFDISPRSLLCGSNTNYLDLLTAAQFY